MHSINGHIIEWTTTRSAVVPGGVDVGERVIAVAHRLLFVIGAKGRAGGGPGQRAECAFLDQLAIALEHGAQHLAGAGDQLEIFLCGTGDQVISLVHRGGHRLVEVDMQPRFNRCLALLIVQPNRRGDGDGVALASGQQFFIAFIGIRNVKAFRRCLRPPRRRITDRRQPHAILHVIHIQVGQNPPHRDAPCAYNAHTNNVAHSWFSF